MIYLNNSSKLLLFYVLFIFIINFYITYNKRKVKYYSNNSLCGGFLNDVEYDESSDICHLPCKLNNSYYIINNQKNTYCGKNYEIVSIINNSLYAKTNVIIKQHKVSNRIYKIYVKKLKKNESANIISEIIEANEINQGKKVIMKPEWHLHFIPKKIKTSTYGFKYSVHFIMFDGGSRFVLKHQLPNTIKYLKKIKKKYTMYDMLKYHSIDYNSFSHFSALFYGCRFNVTENNNTYHKSIFEYFNKEKYITINAHLVCDVTEKFYVNNKYNGSDHNINPPSCDSTYMKNMYKSVPRCLGNRQIHQHYFEYLENALLYYHKKKQPVFSKLIFMDSHDGNLKSLPRIDNDFSKYLQYLNDNGIMDNSVIIIAADHGIQYGKYYETEIFPKSFTNKYPIQSNNMFINQNRFVTAFDVYNTLLELAHLGKNIKSKNKKIQQSLFKRISKKRNCANQKVKFGCSCKVGNKQLDDDNNNSTKLVVNSIEIPSYINIYH